MIIILVKIQYLFRKADVTTTKDMETEAKILEMLEHNKKDFTTLKTWYQQAVDNNQTKSKVSKGIVP